MGWEMVVGIMIALHRSGVMVLHHLWREVLRLVQPIVILNFTLLQWEMETLLSITQFLLGN